MCRWSAQQHLFAAEAFLRNNESFEVTRRAFRTQLILVTLLNNQSILKWTEFFRRHGNAVLKTPYKRVSTVVTPEKVDRVRISIEVDPVVVHSINETSHL